MTAVPADHPVPDARAFWIVAPGRGAIRPVVLPERNGDAVEVRTLFSGISRGTETLVFGGLVPASEHQRMRAPFQDGEFTFPLKYGYVNVGLVEAGPADLIGRTVFSLYPHQTRFVVPRTAVHPIPEGVPPERAVLAANLETAINGVWDAGVQAGDRVVVLGAGAVGSMVAWLLRSARATTVTLADINSARSRIADALGVSFSDPRALSDDADVVVHASGSPEGLVRALEIAAPDGRIVEMSWYGERQVTLPLGGAFHSRRLTIKSSQVGAIPPERRGRWTFGRRIALALQLLSSRELDVLITGDSSFDELPAVMERLAAGAGDTICHRVRYEDR